MDINKKNRDYLKSRFQKNMIPTQADFSDLIDAAANQKDDGVARPPGDALSIEASASGAHPALKLYDAGEFSPAWIVNLRVGDPAAGQKGFVVSDGAGNPRLSISQDIVLTATGTGAVSAGNGVRVDGNRSAHLDVDGALYRTGGEVYLTVDNNLFIRRVGASNPGLYFTVLPDGGGRLGIGRQPGEALDVQGDIRASGRLSAPFIFATGGFITDGNITANGSITCRNLTAPGADAVSLGNGVRVDGNRSAHLDVDGAFYRTEGHVWLTVDDFLFIRRATAPTAAFHFDTNTARLGVGKNNPESALDVQGDIHTTGQITTDGILFAHQVKTPDLAVNGLISCERLEVHGPKLFQIDHPLDPAHKALAHACLEGPEVGVYYRGEGQLNAGRAVITLPSYFEALTRKENRTVMITPRCEGDEPISPLAATTVTDGRLTVRAIDRENLSQRFYWEVKAVRSDTPELEVEFVKKTANSSGANTTGAQ